ncbi:hypothetical protein A1OE_108 [Candidatus Endolissoclinum faulkneri L2]|uniref:Uncharacterized protein n=1 Tax=Candidatus Endolissoclinum faulkneri L2 TaxID=1193729 RepID=K7YNY9_9PROT|nr:hypothetical protein A1OE_108 [Candidatus Endolissoclinum faulkneri L2]
MMNISIRQRSALISLNIQSLKRTKRAIDVILLQISAKMIVQG